MTRRFTAWMTVGLALWLVTAAAAQPKELKPGVWFLKGTQEHPRNAGWIEFEDHVLLIDAGHPWAAASVVTAVKKQTDKPIRFAVETTGGMPRPKSAVQTGATALVPEGRGGPGITFSASTVLSDGKREVVLIPLGRAVSRRDVAVWLPRGKVLLAGDVFTASAFQRFREADIDGWLRALGALEALVAEFVVGGWGRAEGHKSPSESLQRMNRSLEQQRQFIKEHGHRARERVAGRLPWPVAAAKTKEEWVTRQWDLLGRAVDDQMLGGVFPDLPGVGGLNLLEDSKHADPRFLTMIALRYHVAGHITGRVPPHRLIEEYGLREGSSPTRDAPGWVRPLKVVVRANSAERADWLALVADRIRVVAAADERGALKEIADADGVIGFCSKAILEKGKKLRWIQVGSAGVDRYINVPGLKERSEITLTNMQRIYGPEIAEHVFGMLLALTRGLTVAIPLQQRGVWGRSEIGKRSPFVELRGKTLLVVGLGGIGTEVARLGHGLGMRVIATRNSRRSGPPFVEKVGLASDLLALTREADVVVNCTPLTPATTGLFNADYFAAMKPTAYFLNIGRGKSVVTAALMKALAEKKIAGAGLDVTDPEPLPPDHPLWKMDRLVITPHISARSDLRLERVWKLYRENLRRFVAGERLLNVVDKQRGY